MIRKANYQEKIILKHLKQQPLYTLEIYLPIPEKNKYMNYFLNVGKLNN